MSLLHFANSRHICAREAAMASVVNSCLASGIKTELVVNTLDTVGGVDVLDKGDLPAGSTTLAGGDGRSSQEVFPDLKRRISSSTYIT